MKVIQKLTSRKFWVALVTLIAGVLSMIGADENMVQIITGGILALVPTIIYIITEGKIDAASVGAAMQTIGNTVSSAAAADKNENVEPDVDQALLLDSADLIE